MKEKYTIEATDWKKNGTDRWMRTRLYDAKGNFLSEEEWSYDGEWYWEIINGGEHGVDDIASRVIANGNQRALQSLLEQVWRAAGRGVVAEVQE